MQIQIMARLIFIPDLQWELCLVSRARILVQGDITLTPADGAFKKHWGCHSLPVSGIGGNCSMRS